jgi:hypothetical protein
MSQKRTSNSKIPQKDHINKENKKRKRDDTGNSKYDNDTDSYCHDDDDVMIQTRTTYYDVSEQNAQQRMVQHHHIHAHDILLGRGGRNNQHHGNELLRQLARQYAVSYSVASKSIKTNITKQMLHHVRYNWYPPAR